MPDTDCRLIINADDFGNSDGINAAIQQLHAAGGITSASLMVGAPAAGSAIEIARRSPGLGLGLHLCTALARPVLPPAKIPHLVNPHGELDPDFIRAALRWTTSKAARTELHQEVQAQFQRFRSLGFGPAHLDSHVHMLLVPALARIALCEADANEIIGLRIPWEPYASHRARPHALTGARSRLHGVWFQARSHSLRRLAKGRGWVIPERSYGFFQSGALDTSYLTALASKLPQGLSELHCHPSLETPEGRREVEALLSDSFRFALRDRGVRLTTYAEEHQRESRVLGHSPRPG